MKPDNLSDDRIREADSPNTHFGPFDAHFSGFIDQHRSMLAASLDGLAEEEARRRLVPTKTTLLGLVKHAAFRGTGLVRGSSHLSAEG